MVSRKKNKKKVVAPTGIDVIDALPSLNPCTINDYVRAVSTYVQQQSGLRKGPKKAAQIRLSNALGRALAHDLVAKVPQLKLRVGETKVAGALRSTNADVSESDPLDGLRLAVELKPVNLAVGRAIWNRFGDLRTFAVNLHLKFPFAVIGGVLVIPTYEETGTQEAQEAEGAEVVVAEKGESTELELEPAKAVESELDEPAEPKIVAASAVTSTTRSTTHLIERAVKRLIRAGGRNTEGDAAHLLEGIAVVAYNPRTGEIEPDLPPRQSGLRWEEFIEVLAKAYESRFEG